MNWKVTLILCLITVLYVVIGGLIFRAIEEGNETQTRTDMTTQVESFLRENSCVDPEQLSALLIQLFDAYSAGVIVVGNRTSETTDYANWDLHNSIFFAVTVITTIGYGNVAPSTRSGRAFCIFYAIVGIPLLLLALAGVGERLKELTTIVRERSFRRACAPCSPKFQNTVSTLVTTLLGLVLFVFIPAVIFMRIEGWEYSDAVYYCFITLTTIGFGDFVAGWPSDGSSIRILYRLMIIGWIMIGLAWLSGVLTSCQEAYNSFLQTTENAAKSVKEHFRGHENVEENASQGHINNAQKEDDEIKVEDTQLNIRSTPPDKGMPENG